MESSNPRLKPRHAIGIVSRRTGLRSDLIRAWERRYGVVEPARSETRRRLYSDAQVERLRLLRRAVEYGRSIGDVAGLGDRELEELIAEDAAAVAAAATDAPDDPPAADGFAASAASAEARIGGVLAACEETIRRLDQDGLVLELERASVTLSRSHLLERLIGPLLVRIGRAWQEGRLRPVQEHMASAVIRSFVGGLIASSSPRVPRRGGSRGGSRSGSQGGALVVPRVVVATPAGQSHEIGALLVAASAAVEGWQAVYLGSDVAAAEIVAAARATEARVVALSIIYPPDDATLGTELAEIGRRLPAGVDLLVGGRKAWSYRQAVESAGGELVESLGAFRRHLVSVRG